LLRLGDGMMIYRWSFVEGGKRVAFSSGTVHGDSGANYELHDVQSGRLLEKWKGDGDAGSPAWASGLSQ
jgi:hypothetical protein